MSHYNAIYMKIELKPVCFSRLVSINSLRFDISIGECHLFFYCGASSCLHQSTKESELENGHKPYHISTKFIGGTIVNVTPALVIFIFHDMVVPQTYRMMAVCSCMIQQTKQLYVSKVLTKDFVCVISAQESPEAKVDIHKSR